MKQLYEQYRVQLETVMKRREELSENVGEHLRRIQVLDEEIEELWDILHTLREYAVRG